MSGESSEEEDGPGADQGDRDDTNAIQQVGEFVSMIMNSVHQEVAVPGPSGSANVAGVAAGMAMRLACQPTSRRRNSQEPEPLPPIECFPTPPETRSPSCDPATCPNSIRNFLCEAKSLFSYYQRCKQLIEASNRPDFDNWEWLDSCMQKMATHPRVSDKMKLSYYLTNKDNARTFRLIQKNFNLNLDEQFYMGKMNLLHIACDSGWANLASELVLVERMDVNLPCPSEHMRPGNLTPLMLASGAGHKNVVEVLLQRPDLLLDQRDKEGFTAIFHSCNHGSNRVGDQHGYFRRLWSWDLSEEQLNSMEGIARENSRDILRMLITHGCDIQAKDNSGANVLCRASAVENFESVLKFLVEVGCRPTHNALNWTRVKNPGCVGLIESELRTPKSLLRQSRLKVWTCLRSSTQPFQTSLNNLGGDNGLPFILVDYLNCR